MKLFDTHDYKAYLIAWIASLPRNGRGQALQMARHLRVNSVLISQILRGSRDLTLEQAYDLSEYIGHNELETKYFVLQVQLARAGTHRLKAHFKTQLDEIKTRDMDLQNRVNADKKLTPAAASEFYSSWLYSAMRLATSVPELNSLEALSRHFQIPRSKLKPVLDFLIEHSLCVEDGNKIKMGPRTTHLGSNSSMILRHHSNWRMKALSRGVGADEEELFYTSPVSLAASDIPKIRKMILEWIDSFSTVVKDSDSEALACLNIDWFKIS